VTSPVNAPASPVEDGSHNEPTENEPDQLTLRALVSTKEAGVIIGPSALEAFLQSIFLQT
jgi:hypothetical protein